MTMVTRYEGGTKVKGGFYWNLREWNAQVVPREGAALEGGEAAKYVRIPAILVLVLAPIMGAAYAMFLPFIGFAMLAMYLTGKLKGRHATTPPAKEQHADVKHAA